MTKFKNEILVKILIDNEWENLRIIGESSSIQTVFEVNDFEAMENGESSIQLMEGHFYEYLISGNYQLESSEIVHPSRVNLSSGRLVPNIYVGSLTIYISNTVTKLRCADLKVEIRSKKTSYRSDYRLMLEEITEKCVDLLLQASSPIAQNFIPDFNSDSHTLYQRFAFIKSILGSSEFNESIHRILAHPVTTWLDVEVVKDVRSLRRVGASVVRQIAGSRNRIELPNFHPLTKSFKSIPLSVNAVSKQESVDTPENRFVKHAISSFSTFVADFKNKAKIGTRLYDETSLLENHLEALLDNSVFKEIGNPSLLPLNSPILQRKEGYREILRVWLMFDLAAKLIWKGGEDVYEAGKRDVAALYEYWLFFKLLDLIEDIFKIEPESVANLIKPTGDGLGLQLKQGKHIAVKGVYKNSSRELNVEFSFNRSFSGKKSFPEAGSWTKGMRPDFTLSIWPKGITQTEAEVEELILHIHFDAKYKVEEIATIFGEEIEEEEDLENSLNLEKKENDKGNFKRVDLLKMHSYKDAIRRTAGAYILYPGTVTKPYQRQGYHELIPGLGAFAIKPSKVKDGISELKTFLNDIVQHFLNRASQREKIAFRSYDVYNDKKPNELREALPETFGKNRGLLPDEVSVLVGYYKSKEQLDWILRNKLYNFRTGTDSGSLPLGLSEIKARFLLLHGPGEIMSSKIFTLKGTGPKILSRQDLERKKYPAPKGDLYIVYQFEAEIDSVFQGRKWNISLLPNYDKGRGSARPFTATLTELMKALVKS